LSRAAMLLAILKSECKEFSSKVIFTIWKTLYVENFQSQY
jgi:hypothetical protein